MCENKLKEAIVLFKDKYFKEAFEIFNEFNNISRIANEYLGIMYLNGYYVKKDYELAVEKFKKSKQFPIEFKFEGPCEKKGIEYYGLMLFNRNRNLYKL